MDKWLRFDEHLISQAAKEASKIANLPFVKRAVFAPPVCIFATNSSASAANVSAGPVIAVDLDKSPDESLATLRGVLGEPTVIVASGGVWLSEQGEKQAKVHVYWRLTEPATSHESLMRLRYARLLAAELVSGADRTGVSISHPMRWPGSWHTKNTPVLCRIVGGDENNEIELEAAITRLEQAQPHSIGFSAPRGDRTGFKTERPWSAETLLEVARLLPNIDRDWEEWNRIGMAFFDASHGQTEGLDAFHVWSDKSAKGDADITDDRWSHWYRSPPANLSGGTLAYEMRKLDPLWVPRWEANEVHDPGIFQSAGELGPADIFGDEDPGDLGNLPDGALPSMLTRWVRSEARRKGASEAFAAASAVTVLGAAIGADLRVQCQSERNIHPLYLSNIDPPITD
ncbi:MAG: PriCT-2 domain-containing protein [Brucella anthropi]